MNKKNIKLLQKLIGILACVMLLGITIMPINNIYADDAANNDDQTQDKQESNNDNDGTDDADNQNNTDGQNITDPQADQTSNGNNDRSQSALSEGSTKTRGSGVTITAKITDDKNNEIDFSSGTSGEQAVASLCTSTSAGMFSTLYVVNVSFSGFSTTGVTNKEVEIILGGKLFWGEDGSTTGQTPDALDQSKGTNGVTTSDGFELSSKPILQSKIYHVNKDTAGFSLLFTVGVHKEIALKDMPDPITIIVREDGVEKGSTKLDMAKDDRTLRVYYPGDGDAKKTTLDNDTSAPLTKGAVPHALNDSGTYNNGGIHLLDKTGAAIVTFEVSDPNAVLKMRSYNSAAERGVFTFDDSRKQEGIYKLIVKDKQYLYVSHNNASIDYFYLYFPSDKFKVGDSATVTVSSNITHYNPYDEKGINEKHEGKFTYTVVKETPAKLSIASTVYTNPINKDDLDFGLGNESYAPIGYYTVKNEGQVYTDPKVVELRFNGANEGVRGIYLQGYNLGSKTKKFSYTTNKNSSERTVTAELVVGGDGSSNPIHFASGKKVFNLGEGEYLTSVKIYEDAGLPPGNTAYAFYGRVFDDSKKTTLEMRIYDQDDSWSSENALKANLEVNYVKSGAVVYSQNIPSDRHINAGETKEVLNITTFNLGGVVQRPVYYFVVRAKDENNSFLKLKDIRMKSDGFKGSKLNPLQSVMDYVEEYIAEDNGEEVGRVYKLDTTKLPGGAYDGPRPLVTENEGTLATYYGKTFQLFLETTPATPSQVIPFSTMCYYEDGLNTGTSTIPNGISNRKTATGEVYRGGNVLSYTLTEMENSYYIHSVSDLVVQTYAKHHSSDEWISWKEGDEPIAVGNKSSFDIKVDVINGSEKEISGPVYVYIPIPKEGEEWGEMTHETEHDAFEFDVKLNSVTVGDNVSELPAGSYKIEYASVEPSHHGDDLAGEDWTLPIDDPTINCIRISLSNLPENEEGKADEYSFIFNCSADNPQEEGLVNTFRPRYYKAVPGLEMWSYGSYVSLETALGEVRGQLFLDADMDGKFDEGEALAIAGVELIIHDTKNEEVDKVKTNADGEYLFVDLKTKDEYVIKVANPDTDAYLFTRPGTPNTKQSFNTDNQFAGNNNDTEGISTTVYPKMEDSNNNNLTPSVYNVGLIDANTKTKITFNANGGKIGDQTTVVLQDKPTATLTKPANPKKAGTAFHYWYLSTDTQMKEAQIPNTFGFDDLTFMAYYEDILYTVKYETNSDTEIDDKTNVKWNDSGLAPTAVPQKDDYVFEGWYTDANLTTKYVSQKYSELVDDDSVLTATLYAKYTAKKYSITYTNLGDGQNSSSNPTYYTVEDSDIVFVAPVKNRTGYNFDKWNPEKIGSGSSGNKTVEAKWTAIKYNIKYVLGENGQNHSDNPATYTIEDTITLKDPTRKGYVFVKWIEGNTISEGSTGEKTFTAQWKAEEYKIEYDLNKGQGSSDPVNHKDNPVKYTIEQEITLKDASRTGYIFNSWLDEDNKPVDSISKNSTGSRKFKAGWTPIAYVIRFDGGDGAEGEVGDIKAVYDTASRAPENDFYMEGHDFEGWVDDNNNVYQPGDDLKNLTDQNGAVVVLKAKWVAFSYSCESGEYQVWTKGSSKNANFVFKRSRKDELTFGNFIETSEVVIDGNPVDSSCFTAEAGSLKLGLTPAYLRGLSAGKHNMTVYFLDGSVTVEFTVRVINSDGPSVSYQIPNTGITD